MKILHVVRQFYPAIGGVENFVHNLARRQIVAGNDIAVLTLNRSFQDNRTFLPEEVHDGIKITRIGFWGSKRYAIAPSCIKYLDGFDIIHIHCVDFFIDYLALLKPLHKKKMILHTHGGFFHIKWLTFFKKIYFYTVTRMIAQGCDRIIACSDNDYDMFARISRNVVLIENGVDIERYNAVVKNIEFGSLVYVGRIDDNKRIEDLISVTSCLIKRNIKVMLRIIGEDYSCSVPRLRGIATALGIADKVFFLGRISDADLLKEISRANVFVSASEYEAFGISAVEAMASGTVCVLNNIPSFKKFMDRAGCGIITDYKDREGAARAIEEVLKMDAARYRQMGEAARQRASLYSWKGVEEKVHAVYKEVLA